MILFITHMISNLFGISSYDNIDHKIKVVCKKQNTYVENINCCMTYTYTLMYQCKIKVLFAIYN